MSRIAPESGFRRSRRALALLAALLLGALSHPPAASAGPVTFRGGALSLSTGEGEPGVPVTESVTLTPSDFPGSDTRRITSQTTFRGFAEVTYDLRDAADSSVFESNVLADGVNGLAVFSASFDTSAPTRFTLFADPRAFFNFSVSFTDVGASARFNPFGDPSFEGNLVGLDDQGRPNRFEAKTFQGVLPAGTHTLEVIGQGGRDRNTDVSGGGFVRLTVTADGANPIPLPPGAWAGGATLAAAAVGARVLRSMRRGRRLLA